ncbi:hypothetical protein ACPWT1_06640 [Ramlibacter sp. MMS24-I3-19]|uniref:hypothetical protein n=1 Tax=Ramlibacter sp. MMS24-I3-19 TaxID=3416606 RepID=UPI003D031D7F
MGDSSRLLREWQMARDSLRAANLAFAASVGRRAPMAEQLALAREVGHLQDEEYRLHVDLRALRVRRGFWSPMTIPGTLPGALS